MTALEAQRVVESLRKGIPPDGFVQHFTVGRAAEIERLKKQLGPDGKGALLLQANYGSGKSHLLRLIREVALERGFAVSCVSLDAQAAVRFNRMDQILGAICRNIEVPGSSTKGIRPLFDLICEHASEPGLQSRHPLWNHLTNNGKWDYSGALESKAIYVAIRAWVNANADTHDRVIDWLSYPWNYRSQRQLLYVQLVWRLREFFREPRSERQFILTEVFSFHPQGYAQSWAALRDMHKLAQAAGLSGLIILFDEFEDVITNLNHIGYQEDAFWNLFQFYSGEAYPGMTFYAVTPEFASKCKTLLLRKGRWDFDYSRFESIPTFQMTPLDKDELLRLAPKIAEAHGDAFGWTPVAAKRYSELKNVVAWAAAVPVQDRARQTIKSVVQFLDDLVEDA